MRARIAGAGGSVVVLLATILILALPAKAAVPPSFSLSVTPSPIVATVNPGQTTTLQFKILNSGSGTEKLQVSLHGFSINSKTGVPSISDAAPPEISQWISFSAPKFTLPVGQWLTEQMQVAIPQQAGFSYSLALVISRQNTSQPLTSGQTLKASLADFVLLNVNRPGAKKVLSVPTFAVSQHVYQWLPTTFSIKFDNTGNSIVQPYGNVFIERNLNSKTPIATLAVNTNGGYVLPDTSRTFTDSWSNGFPVYKTTLTAAGTNQRQLTWNWSKLSDFRFGRYTAQLVAVYNNGVQDVPIEGTVTFWVIPWEMLIGIIVVGLLLFFGVWFIVQNCLRILRKRRQRRTYRKV